MQASQYSTQSLQDHEPITGSKILAPIDLLPSMPKGPISSSRFFFTPTTTKSLMGDTEVQRAGFLKTSLKTPLSSMDPYADFRHSMEEMVEAYKIRELPQLHELLHCYLGLNQRKNHNAIILAFVDFLADLLAQGRIPLL